MPAIRRTLKNVVKNYSDAQVKVREATSNDPWGPSSTLMSEIADLTYNVMAFTEIMQMVWKRLNDDGKNWRHVYKSLVVLDYIIKTGSEKVAQQCKENFHAIKTLTSFQYIDADNKDQGMNVREKAKHLVAMLSDDERLKNERAKALKAKERFAQNAMGVGSSGTTTRSKMRLEGSPSYDERLGHPDSSPGSCSASTPSEIESARPSSAGEEELQLQLALAMSREEHDEVQRKAKSDDIKLAMAIEQSKEQAKTERKRQHQYSSSPASSTLLDIAGSTASGGAGGGATASDPWGVPLSAAQPAATDPWGARLPASQPPAADPWGSGPAQPSVSPVPQPSVSPAPTTDPWGLPAAQAPPPQAASAGWSASASPALSAPAPQLDAFGCPVAPSPVTNGNSATNGGTGNVLDNEFDLLSSRSNDPSPSKAPALDEFDLLSGGPSNGSSGNTFDMAGLGQELPQDKKPKKAEDFLGANANLVNLDQLVSKAPPKGNNPFAMTSAAGNPFQAGGGSTPMAQMGGPGVGATGGFSQPTMAGGLLPAPLLPLGQPSAMPPAAQGPPPPQQNYNPFL